VGPDVLRSRLATRRTHHANKIISIRLSMPTRLSMSSSRVRIYHQSCARQWKESPSWAPASYSMLFVAATQRLRSRYTCLSVRHAWYHVLRTFGQGVRAYCKCLISGQGLPSHSLWGVPRQPLEALPCSTWNTAVAGQGTRGSRVSADTFKPGIHAMAPGPAS
jgi:hypothetical protein